MFRQIFFRCSDEGTAKLHEAKTKNSLTATGFAWYAGVFRAGSTLSPHCRAHTFLVLLSEPPFPQKALLLLPPLPLAHFLENISVSAKEAFFLLWFARCVLHTSVPDNIKGFNFQIVVRTGDQKLITAGENVTFGKNTKFLLKTSGTKPDWVRVHTASEKLCVSFDKKMYRKIWRNRLDCKFCHRTGLREKCWFPSFFLFLVNNSFEPYLYE